MESKKSVWIIATKLKYCRVADFGQVTWRSDDVNGSAIGTLNQARNALKSPRYY